MSTTRAASAAGSRRQRPEENGGIIWHREFHAFQCLGCEGFHEVRKRREYDDPEFLASTRELLIVDHTECWEFADPRMARDARRFRKAKKLRENLAAQRASWRGR